MPKKIVAASLLFLGVNAGAVAPSAAQGSCALPALAASATLQDVAQSDLMTVPVQVNGTPKQFLLDIGTNTTEISQAAVKELGLTQPKKQAYGSLTTPQMYGPESSSGVGGQTASFGVVDVNSAKLREDRLPLVGVDSFTIGQATGHNLVFAVANSKQISEAQPYDGLMTGSFFKQYDVELDFSAKKISYLTPTACTELEQVAFWPHERVAAVPMAVSGGKITVQVTIRGRPINAVIDTSAAHTTMRRDVAERILALKGDTPEMMPADDLHDGQGVRIYRHVIPLVAFADGIAAHDVAALIQTNPMTASPNREPILGSRASFQRDTLMPDLTLGMDVLRQFHIYVVYAQNSIYVTAAK